MTLQAMKGQIAKGSGARPSASNRSKSDKKASAKCGNQTSESHVFRFFRLLVRTAVKAVWAVGWRASATCALILAVAVYHFYSLLPEPDTLVDGRSRGSVILLDRNDRPFAWRGMHFGGAVTPDNVSPHLKNAVISTEDRRFYRHFGLSPRGIARAVWINLREGRGPFDGHGGSTITQQVAKLLCFGAVHDPSTKTTEAEFERECRRTTLWRKVKEIPFAFALELKYTKDEILMIYLNRAYLGAGATGFEAASNRYFGKSAMEVGIAESAMLAGLLVAPSYYAPTRKLARAQSRANLVVSLMHDQGYLTFDKAKEARLHPARPSEGATGRLGGYFADWMMDSGPEFLTHDTTEDVIIRTTFDARIQAAAEEALTQVFRTRVRPGSKAQAAIVIISRDGKARAMVGGRDVKASGKFNRATKALRQTGSSFKPFVYAAALEAGSRFDTEVVDEPVSFRVPGSGTWSPKNYTSEHLGRISLTDALALSVNTVAAKVSESVGRAEVRQMAEGFGITSKLVDSPALALGASESTLLEMTGAYAGILNGGRRVEPYGLIDIRLSNDDQPLITKSERSGRRVMSERSARQLVYMLHQAVVTGTGQRANLPDREVAGKTGTTQGAKDAWFIGFSADYIAGVWMGYDDNTKLVGVTGGGLPAEIWRETMRRIHSDLEARRLPMIDPNEFASSEAKASRLEREQSASRNSEGFFEAIARIFGGGN